MNAASRSVAVLENLTQTYGKVTALDEVTISIPADCMVGLIGPDGVGKSTLLAIIAGARQNQSGSATVHSATSPTRDTEQRFVRGSPTCRRAWARISTLISASARISSFLPACLGNPATSVHGGSQNCLIVPGWLLLKIGQRRNCREACARNSACAVRLIHDPDLLILDEPTTGVSPLLAPPVLGELDRCVFARATRHEA